MTSKKRQKNAGQNWCLRSREFFQGRDCREESNRAGTQRTVINSQRKEHRYRESSVAGTTGKTSTGTGKNFWLTSDQAKEQLLSAVKEDVKHETAMYVKEMETRAKEDARKKAKEYVVTAIQKCAVDHVAETTISLVQLKTMR